MLKTIPVRVILEMEHYQSMYKNRNYNLQHAVLEINLIFTIPIVRGYLAFLDLHEITQLSIPTVLEVKQ